MEPDVDPDRLGAPGVVPGGPEREAERRPPDAREEGDPPAARGERQVVVGERSGEPRGRPDAEQAVVAARDVVPLVDDREGDLGEREREHREVNG